MMNNSEYALELLDEAKKVSVEARHGPLIEKAQKRLLVSLVDIHHKEHYIGTQRQLHNILTKLQM